jgi:hypothetical protein
LTRKFQLFTGLDPHKIKFFDLGFYDFTFQVKIMLTCESYIDNIHIVPLFILFYFILCYGHFLVFFVIYVCWEIIFQDRLSFVVTFFFSFPLIAFLYSSMTCIDKMLKSYLDGINEECFITVQLARWILPSQQA